MKLVLPKSDALGVFSSALCTVHCLATPFLFIAQTCSASCCSAAPDWWRWLDYIFLVVSFFAVYHATKTSSNTVIKRALWLSWIVLLAYILNEAVQWVYMPETVKYGAAFALIVLHLYNMRYCQCVRKNCVGS